MDLYQQQVRNRRTTAALFMGFGVIFTGLGCALQATLPFDMWVPVGVGHVEAPVVTLGALALSVAWSAFAYYRGDQLVLSACEAKALQPENPKHRQFQNVAEEMAIASGLPVPSLYVLPDDDLNAFATGRSPQHASIAVTSGLLDALDREELQAVVGHEMAHIRNEDIRTMMVVTVLLSAVALIVDIIRMMNWSGSSSSSSSSSRRDKNGASTLAAVVIALVANTAARVCAAAVLRTREFEADRTSAELTRNPLALAKALAKLEASEAPTRLATPRMAHLFIADPRGAVKESKGFMGDMLATHPPAAARIERLQMMGHEPLPSAATA